MIRRLIRRRCIPDRCVARRCICWICGLLGALRSGRLSFAGADVPGNELRAIILGWIYENQYYDEDFNPDVPQSPACYAFGTDTGEMAPHVEHGQLHIFQRGGAGKEIEPLKNESDLFVPYLGQPVLVDAAVGNRLQPLDGRQLGGQLKLP